VTDACIVELRTVVDAAADEQLMTVTPESTTTLEYLMRDSVEHLKHHLRQIERLLGRTLPAWATTPQDSLD
jgi:hypothetical protein